MFIRVRKDTKPQAIDRINQDDWDSWHWGKGLDAGGAFPIYFSNRDGGLVFSLRFSGNQQREIFTKKYLETEEKEEEEP